LILSTPGSGGGAQKERHKKKAKRAVFSMFDLINQNTSKDKDLCYSKQAFYHRKNYSPVLPPHLLFFSGRREKPAAISPTL